MCRRRGRSTRPRHSHHCSAGIQRTEKLLRENAAEEGVASNDPLSGEESSTSSHMSALRDGIETVLRHPWGYGLGNAGVSASRSGVEVKAGESTYTELGVDTGVAGMLAFVLWSLAVLAGLWRREAWLAAAFATVLVIGLQTDVIGIHWLAFTVWVAAGLALGLPRRRHVADDAAGEDVSAV